MWNGAASVTMLTREKSKYDLVLQHHDCSLPLYSYFAS